ncbi:uncharacterized protein LOC130904119 [Diorhabda carinulata]|uniref:uncharacterized protein LOC130904119 n=1 Tax=Diorhabda carinulata TaxID=1163345 RepID=UPI0025A03E4B|nr:uncharacterized protein LOC130904119 [Diorhabda carinulata]
MNEQVNKDCLTPKSHKNKSTSNNNGSELIGSINACQISDEFFKNLMSDPSKRELILNIITSERDKIDAYKKKLELKNQRSPFYKSLKKPCESPTALHRRRVLERLRNPQTSDSTSDSDSSRPTSRQSTSSKVNSSVPFDKILDGVIAFVEVKSGVRDRSEAVKSHLRCMGAVVREKFTKDVTHVIFKEGQFSTYQKANLMKVHLVSVLWLEACKTSGTKVPEKKYPAFGTTNYDHNVSILCSQIQKDYEEIIREEYQRTKQTGTLVPSTTSLVDRRKTFTNHITRTNKTGSPTDSYIFDDDSDTNPIIDGDFSENNSEVFISRRKMGNFDEDMDLTNVLGESSKENRSPNNKSKNDDFYKRKTLSNSNTDKPKSSRIFNKNELITDDAVMNLTPRTLRIFNKDDVVYGTNMEKPTESTGTCMSSLRISDKSKNGIKTSFNSETFEISFSPLPPNVINDVLDKLRDSSEENDLKIIKNKTPMSKMKITSPNKDQNEIKTRRQTMNVAIFNKSPSKQLKRSKSSIDLGKNLSPDSQNKKKFRKLYTPTDFRELVVDDEKEREEKRKARKPKSRSGVFIKPITLFQKNKDLVEKNEENIINSIEIQKPADKKRDSDEDEQVGLKKEILNKQIDKETPRRRSVRLINMKNTPVTPSINRRSTLEFQPQSAKRKLKIDVLKKPSIVCTKMHKSEVQIFLQIVKKIGGFDVEDEVSEKTTHLVAGEPKRTINMLKALAMGCWILKKEWLFSSLESGKWLPEEDFEETDFSPAVQKNRIQRQAFGPSYTMDIFRDYGPMYVAKGSIPRCSDLRELIQLCKGRITAVPRCARIIIGEYVEYDAVICVKETWVLDCISQNKKFPFKKYLIK